MTDIPDSARSIIQALMEEVGLGSLGDWAWAQYQSGVEPKDIVVLARQTPEYAARYPAMLREAIRIGGFRNVYFVSHRPEVVAQADAVIEITAAGAVTLTT